MLKSKFRYSTTKYMGSSYCEVVIYSFCLSMTVKCGGIRDESDITKVRKSNVKESIKLIITFLREKKCSE